MTDVVNESMTLLAALLNFLSEIIRVPFVRRFKIELNSLRIFIHSTFDGVRATAVMVIQRKHHVSVRGQLGAEHGVGVTAAHQPMAEDDRDSLARSHLFGAGHDRRSGLVRMLL